MKASAILVACATAILAPGRERNGATDEAGASGGSLSEAAERTAASGGAERQTRSAGSMQAPDPAAASSPRHPLDPLSAAEVTAAIAALAKAGRVDEFALYPLVTLEEPPKALVLAWTPGQAIPRRAFIIDM